MKTSTETKATRTEPGSDFLANIAHLSDYDQLRALVDQAAQSMDTSPAGKAQGAAKARGPVALALEAARSATASRKGGKALSASPLARSIQNAYKSAKPGRQVAGILRRIEDATPKPKAQEIARALVGSGIPPHHARKVAADWDAVEALAKAQAGKPDLLAQLLEDADPVTGVSARLRAQLAEQLTRDAQHQAAAAARSLPAGQWEWEDLGRILATWPEANAAGFLSQVFGLSEKGKGYAIALEVLRGINPAPDGEKLERLLSGISERDRMVIAQQYRDGWARRTFDKLHKAKAEGGNLMEAIAGPDPLKLAAAGQGAPTFPHLEKAFGPDPLGPIPENDKGPALPEDAEDCPAYVKAAFDSAAPDCIAKDTAAAIVAVMETWKPGGRPSTDGQTLFDLAGIPSEWKSATISALLDAERAAERAAQKAEVERRTAQAPQHKAEAPAHREGAYLAPGEAQDLRAQIDVVIGLVDGVTNLLAERDPEDRETRKLSALREQVENLIGLLDPVLSGQEGGGR